MSLKPIDPNALRDSQDQGADNFTQGARGIHHYDTQAFKMSDKQENPHRIRLFGIIAAAVVLVVAVLAIIIIPRYLGDNQQSDTVAAGTEVTVVIPSGVGAGDIAQLLQEAGVISSTTSFMTEVESNRASNQLKPGTYVFVGGDSYADVVAQLIKGPDETSITIPEGFTVSQIAARVEQVLGIQASDFLTQAKASNYSTDYDFLAGAYGDSLEGFLYPDTYQFAQGVTADEVIRTMLDQFKIATSTVDFSTATLADGTVLTKYQVVTIASLIEREAALSGERPLVSSVIYNRLNAGMYLQIDAAIAYATGNTGLLSYDDLMVDSPYNVYLYLGLPAGPICSPSIDSIRAAAAPEATDFYYYVAAVNDEGQLDGSHTFCTNEDEFVVAKDAYNVAVGLAEAPEEEPVPEEGEPVEPDFQ